MEPTFGQIQNRRVTRVISAERKLEGGGFPVRRPFPSADLALSDPFLLLDEMGPVDWPAGGAIGAPDHPHRGFETVTYLLAGHMQHRDSGGHVGELRAGDAQWMTAGSGVVHSEMPHADFQRQGGVMHGFQLWVNLPAAEKMIPPRYQDVPAKRIPMARSPGGRVEVKVIAGNALGASAVIDTRLPISYLHFSLLAGAEHHQPLVAGHGAFVYVFKGAALIGEEAVPVADGQLAELSPGASVRLATGAQEQAELLLLAGPILDEPVARHGPFVMNTQAQIAQAVRDYQAGRMGEIPAAIG